MLTLLLTDEQDTAGVILRRRRIRERLVVRLRARHLDTAIAQGACPDSTAALSLRANTLIGHATRRRLWRSIRRLLREAERPRARIHETAPVCWRKVRQARPTLEELADQLLGFNPVEAMGVAQVHLLLTDGQSPLYSDPQANDLEQALEAAIDALEPRR